MEHLGIPAGHMRDLRPPPKGIFGLATWCAEAWQHIVQGRITRSPGTIVRQGRRGASISALGSGEDTTGGTLQFKNQWVDGPYSADDIVICETHPEEDNGYKGGTFIANADVVTGDLHPGLVPDTATAGTVTVAGGSVTVIPVATGGEGYGSAPPVTISGDGTGATAHAVLTGTVVTSIVVDTGGSGYTSATAVIGDPDKAQKWDHFAVRPREAFTMRPVAAARNKQAIVFDCGRDTSKLPLIRLRKDNGDGSQGSIDLDIAALLAITGAGDYVIKPREWHVCVEGEDMFAIFLSTAGYTRP